MDVLASDPSVSATSLARLERYATIPLRFILRVGYVDEKEVRWLTFRRLSIHLLYISFIRHLESHVGPFTTEVEAEVLPSDQSITLHLPGST